MASHAKLYILCKHENNPENLLLARVKDIKLDTIFVAAPKSHTVSFSIPPPGQPAAEPSQVVEQACPSLPGQPAAESSQVAEKTLSPLQR
jgi:hypothetical protein